MQKSEAVAAMGNSALLLPAWIKAALAANDRLKLYLTILQAAAAHAEHPDAEPLDLGRETAAAGIEGRWLRDLPAASSQVDGALLVPELRRLAQRLAEDLGVMARPLLEAHRTGDGPHERVKHWIEWLGALGDRHNGGDTLNREQLLSLTSGKRDNKRDGKHGHGGDGSGGGNDSLHLLVMDLHKQLNQLAGTLSDEQIDAFLVEVLCLASKALLAGQPIALVADETRMLLARRIRQRNSEFDLIEEHAAYCHALAQAVSDGLAHDVTSGSGKGAHKVTGKAARSLAERAKVWERKADHLVMRARDQAQRQRRWQPVARLLELSDDIADALEEAAFLMSLLAEDHRQGWNAEVHQILSKLAQAVLAATQEHIKALAIARRLASRNDSGSDAADGDAFLAASWNVLRSERECDELLRAARRAILAAIKDAASLMLANDLAIALELASDRLLVAGYALRDVAFDQAGARA